MQAQLHKRALVVLRVGQLVVQPREPPAQRLEPPRAPPAEQRVRRVERLRVLLVLLRVQRQVRLELLVLRARRLELQVLLRAQRPVLQRAESRQQQAL